MDPYFALIMAGGGGTRLWPLSRQKRPKQALRLLGEGSMFQLSVQRLAPIFTPERILVVTSAAYAADLHDQCPELPAGNFILEPEPRGTAAAIGLAAWHIQRRDPTALMACLTADHYIGNEGHFCDALTMAAYVAQENYLVTLGISPEYPATGFGYIQRGDRLGILGGFEVYRSGGFKEKPGRSEAEAMVDSGDYYWNSGMFIWRAGRILQEFARHMPGFYEQLTGLEDSPERLPEIWSKAPITTIDYGIMERVPSEDVAIIPVKNLEWNDVGSWDSLLDILQPDQDGNVVVGEHVGLSTTGSLIHTSRRYGHHPLVATIGVSDLVIVDTDDVLLVCPRERAQDVRQLVEQLRERGDRQEYL